MSILANKAPADRPKPARVYVPTTALARTVEFSEEAMQVFLTDGRTLSVPLLWFPRLAAARPEQRANVEIGGGGIGLHWPEIDEDLSVANLMAGGDWRST